MDHRNRNSILRLFVYNVPHGRGWSSRNANPETNEAARKALVVEAMASRKCRATWDVIHEQAPDSHPKIEVEQCRTHCIDVSFGHWQA